MLSVVLTLSWPLAADAGIAGESRLLAASAPVSETSCGPPVPRNVNVDDRYEPAPTGALADSVRRADALYDREQYAEALDLYREAARAGQPRALRHIGLYFDLGQIVPRDYVEAMRWYRRAVAAGSPTAPVAARQWFLKAANLGFAPAMDNLGMMYCFGAGVPRDYESAAAWFRKASQHGSDDAMYNPGLLYDKGALGSVDYGQAMQWYQKAASRRNAGAMNNIGAHYQNGMGVPQSTAIAVVWYTKAAALGDRTAKINLAGVGAAVLEDMIVRGLENPNDDR